MVTEQEADRGPGAGSPRLVVDATRCCIQLWLLLLIQKSTLAFPRTARGTEVFVLRKGQWVNPGWHMDSGK